MSTEGEYAKRRFVYKKRGFVNMTHHLVHIIEDLVNGTRDQAIRRAEFMVERQTEKCAHENNVRNRLDAMTARNVLHVLRGEPKEGGVTVMDQSLPPGSPK